jgi:hypothetical protein
MPATTIRPSLRTPGADPRFSLDRRGPYWQPGDSIMSEPWVALGESNTGHVVLRTGRNVEHAHALVGRWRAEHEQGIEQVGGRLILGGAVVAPSGEVVSGWGSVPEPGAAPRWSPLLRVLQTRPCGFCGAERWPGCWVGAPVVSGQPSSAWRVEGCHACLPEREQADPRVWPHEPAEPGAVPEGKRRPSTPRKSNKLVVATEVPTDQGSLLDYRAPVG